MSRSQTFDKLREDELSGRPMDYGSNRQLQTLANVYFGILQMVNELNAEDEAQYPFFSACICERKVFSARSPALFESNESTNDYRMMYLQLELSLVLRVY